MAREEVLESALRELIQQTDQALAEGSIYTDQFKEELDKARKALPNQTQNDRYSDSGHGFHVVQQ